MVCYLIIRFIVMFTDRYEAGEKLATLLKEYKSSNTLIYALPRGGVVTGYAIAKELKVALEIINIKKIGHPDFPEYAIAAVSDTGHCIINTQEKYIDKKWFEDEVEHNRKEADRRRGEYYQKHAELSALGKTIVIVDDGVATGLSLYLAINEIKSRKPKEIIVAVPIIPELIASKIIKICDRLVSIQIVRERFGSVSDYYKNFNQISDKEVIALLSEIWQKK